MFSFFNCTIINSIADCYDRAIEKLKDLVSYNLSEVCTDKEGFYKSQRKLRAKRKIFSSEDDFSDSGKKNFYKMYYVSLLIHL